MIWITSVLIQSLWLRTVAEKNFTLIDIPSSERTVLNRVRFFLWSLLVTKHVIILFALLKIKPSSGAQKQNNIHLFCQRQRWSSFGNCFFQSIFYLKVLKRLLNCKWFFHYENTTHTLLLQIYILQNGNRFVVLWINVLFFINYYYV